MDIFIKIFLEQISKTFSYFMNPKEFIDNIYKALNDMVENTEYRINEEIFMESCKKYINEKDIKELKKD
ncbi:hypothetical protein [Defluviitalea phaphyphila]|uniref:hypothetical protein n=1 Tax=Defluviitalea phaphyphila TaxID=1473580 RepID=UPI001A9A5DF4|nr:hypothetical protein [Defluviitalea phaphyphila]